MKRGRVSEDDARHAEALDRAYTVATLKKFCSLLGVSSKGRKADLIDAMMTRLKGDGLREVWEQLDALSQAAISEVVHAGENHFEEGEFFAKYGEVPSFGELEGFCSQPPHLLALFLIVDGSDMPRMPLDLKRRLRGFVPEPRPVQLQTVECLPELVREQRSRWQKSKEEEHPLIVEEREQTAGQELFAVLRLIEAGKISASAKTNKVAASSAAKISHAIGDFYTDADEMKGKYHPKILPIKPFAWPLLIQAAGLAQVKGSKLLLTKSGRAALSVKPYEVLRKVWVSWEKTRMFDEFSRIDVVKGQRAKGGVMTSVSERRACISDALSDCPVGEWIAVDEFFRYMQAAGYQLEIARNIGKLYVKDSYYGGLGHAGYHEWSILQGRYVLSVLFEYAAVIGMIDIAYVHPSHARNDFRGLWGVDDLSFFSRYDGLKFFRLSPLGEYILGLEDNYEPPAPSQGKLFRALPNLTIVSISGEIPQHILAVLEQFTVQTSDFVWALDRDKALESLNLGASVEEMVRLLEQTCEELPASIQLFFSELEERTTCFHPKGEAILVECEDPSLALMISQDRICGKFCMLAGERHLVVLKKNAKTVQRAIRKMGYLFPVNG